MIKLTSKGDFGQTTDFLEKSLGFIQSFNADKYGEEGVEALKAATPVKTGKTANSWRYEVVKSNGRVSITWYNDNMADRVSVALLIQLGHATRSGYYVQGLDYINPALEPVFKRMGESAWREINR